MIDEYKQAVIKNNFASGHGFQLIFFTLSKAYRSSLRRSLRFIFRPCCFIRRLSLNQVLPNRTKSPEIVDTEILATSVSSQQKTEQRPTSWVDRIYQHPRRKYMLSSVSDYLWIISPSKICSSDKISLLFFYTLTEVGVNFITNLIPVQRCTEILWK